MLKNFIRHKFLPAFFACSAVFFISTHGFSQNVCLTEAEAARVIQTIDAPVGAKENKKLRRELLKMQEAQLELAKKILSKPEIDHQQREKSDDLSRKNINRLCEIFKRHGWLREDAVGLEGTEAVLFLIRSSSDTNIQRQLFPLVAEATQKGYIPKANLANLIDLIRTKEGGTQIFGTQIRMIDEIAYLFPLENEANIDKWRKLYDLPTLSEYIKYIETEYQTVVMKPPAPPKLRGNRGGKDPVGAPDTDNPALGLTDDEDEVINIESRLVNLNVLIFNRELSKIRGLNLRKEDFIVLENGMRQEVSFFSTAEKPFDLVLVLDLSGSTRQKQDLIAASARRFIELARPADRIAVVTFTNRTTIVSDFTGDKHELLKKVEKIDDSGNSKVWDALAETFRKLLLPSQENGKRSAVIFMTDGVDNTFLQSNLGIASLYLGSGIKPSEITFTELLETVGQTDVTIFPIYLDTEKNYSGRYDLAKPYRLARKTLQFLAEETGGEYYRAEELQDLNGIYEQIINDLSEVYSLGYEPKNSENDGTWRELTVKIKDRPDLIVRSKRGYHAD